MVVVGPVVNMAQILNEAAMMRNPNQAMQVALLAQQLTAALLPPVKRRKGEQPDARLRQIEKDIQRGRIKVGLHLAEVLIGRSERESADSICRFFQTGEAIVRATLGTECPPDDPTTLGIAETREQAEADIADRLYMETHCPVQRLRLITELRDHEDALRRYRERLESDAYQMQLSA